MKPNFDNGDVSGPESSPSDERKGSVLTGAEVRGASPMPVGRANSVDAIIALVSAIVEAVSAWIAGIRMRLKIKRDLGRKATEADLTSIDTWIKVDQVDKQNKRNGPLKPG